jgi:hypothetical protein
MSVRPTASHTRTPEGTGIIARHHVENPLQCRGVNVAVDANPSATRQLNLDQPRCLTSPATWRLTAGLPSAIDAGNEVQSWAISTATKDGSSEAPGTAMTPSSASRRHLYTWAGSSPCRRATAERFAPAAVASASFCSTLNRRRRSMRPSNSIVG